MKSRYAAPPLAISPEPCVSQEPLFPPDTHTPQAYKKLKHFETAYVVKLHNFKQLDAAKPCFRFVHPNKEEPIDNRRYTYMTFESTDNATIHGLAGYFEAKLYKDIDISECWGRAKGVCVECSADTRLPHPLCRHQPSDVQHRHVLVVPHLLSYSGMLMLGLVVGVRWCG